MSLTFLVPAFLAGLLALVVPILVHLSRRETKEPVPFPSLMFLQNLPQKRTEKRRIHRWPLFLLRCLAITLLVLAFARPFLEREGAPVVLANGTEREVVVLVDRSYSMGMADRWERAVEAATEALGDLTVRDRGTIVFFDEGAESATESTSDRNVLLTALRTAEPGVGTTRYAPGLRYAARVLAASPLPRRELVVISDFQRAGWEADAAEIGSIRLPAGTVVSTVSVVEEGLATNLTMESADFEREIVEGRERVTITGRLVASGPVPGPVQVTLEADGRVVETRQADFGEGSSAQVTFSPLTLPEAGATRGVLRLPDDVLQVDNRLHFVLSSDQRIPVLIVEGPGAASDGSFFLERALSIGGSPGFRTTVRRSGEFRAADLAGNPVVILNQAPIPGGEQGERLKSHVARGGGLIILLGNNDVGSWPDVLPSVPSAVDRRSGGGVAFGYVDTGHPVFEAFAGPRTGDFGSVRVFRYRPVPTGAFPRVLARFGDGGIALAERPVENGRVLVWSSPVDAGWTDIAVQPVFLPFVHQLVKYAAGYRPPAGWLTIGEPFDARGVLPPGDEYVTVLTPSSEQVRLTNATLLNPTEVGFYEVRNQRGSEVLTSFAANVDPSESEQTLFDPAQMETVLEAATQAPPTPGSELELTLQERERRQNGWWYLIVVAFVLLAVETLLSNRGGGFAEGRRWWRGAGRDGGRKPEMAV